MSTKVLVENARVRFNHSESRIYLVEKYTNKLTVPHAGGMWNVTIELLAFLQSSTQDEIVLVDSYNNPIKVVRQELLAVVTEKYNNVMNDWHKEYSDLVTQR
jgi:hypothetical protein